MNAPDFRQQQESEEERLSVLLAILNRVASGQTGLVDAKSLASELGIHQWFEQKEAA